MEIRRKPPNTPIKVEYLRYQIKHPESEPRHILEEIVWQKEIEVEKRREVTPLIELQKAVKESSPPRDFLGALKNCDRQPALIAEIKKASPSKGVICEDFDPIKIAKAYQKGGANCLSVLTDENFFQGSFENLALVRRSVDLPLLCKEFIIYPYQIYLARSTGADAVLLIAAILSDRDLHYFLKIIHKLGMTALIEVHTLGELDRVLALESVTLIGINNRNLEDFKVNLQTTVDLLKARGEILKERNILIVSESGLQTPEDLNQVKKAGANAILVGESLVKKSDPTQAIADLFGV